MKQDELRKAFSDFIARPSYPCVGAKSALGKKQVKFVFARDICSAWNDLEIVAQLTTFAQAYKSHPKMFQSLVVIFEDDKQLTETEFETALWERLQSLHDKDQFQGFYYDEAVEADPAHPEFSLSFGGEAFFAVGLHPGASRKARRFRRNVIVFNLHDQFERLRDDGRYGPMRTKILERDKSWTGSVNPMLAIHGSISEARQYSGRAVEPEWKCPFKPNISGEDYAIGTAKLKGNFNA